MINKRLKLSVAIPLLWVTAIWLVIFAEYGFDTDFTPAGILPRTVVGIPCIASYSFIHAGWQHLLANSMPLFILSWILFYFYKDIALKVALFSIIGGGVITWIIGRDAYHIGASGVVYALAAFLFFSGIIRHELRRGAIALVVAFLYGSMTWSVFPISELVDPAISWEGHLSGAITGAILAFIFRNEDREHDKPLFSTDTNDDDDDDHLENEHHHHHNHHMEADPAFPIMSLESMGSTTESIEQDGQVGDEELDRNC